MQPSSISTINRLPSHEKREIFTHMIPAPLLERFHLSPFLVDKQGNDLLSLQGKQDSQSLELSIYHIHPFLDPILYCHLADTLTGQIHVLLYIMNDPDSPRFDVDKMPDGTPTKFGTRSRNLAAEQQAMEAGLYPGQIRKGLNMLAEAVDSFDQFVGSLGHDMYFIEPLYYHNAIIFERYGFKYQSGRRRMKKIHLDFKNDQALKDKLGSTPFRHPEAVSSIFYRAWAIHDGILDEPFDNITMYKVLGAKFKVDTAPDVKWI